MTNSWLVSWRFHFAWYCSVSTHVHCHSADRGPQKILLKIRQLSDKLPLILNCSEKIGNWIKKNKKNTLWPPNTNKDKLTLIQSETVWSIIPTIVRLYFEFSHLFPKNGNPWTITRCNHTHNELPPPWTFFSPLFILSHTWKSWGIVSDCFDLLTFLVCLLIVQYPC